ncbi:hypothetical protein QFZ65_001783 [Arthrobacter sp. B3I9]|uniref:hypothetical protein n=1 Tax=Arthrobacter sp. B3I9 TaxID=3042270 RepID=UPI002793A9A6|nr:hypothetical protein [Arthrobacter sp. B3I9]MDQ0849845.1 hypothetical protein [Arthrobacter sp. B3I9]
MNDEIHANSEVLLAGDVDFFIPKHLEKTLSAFTTATLNAFARPHNEHISAKMTREEASENFREAYDKLRLAMRKDLGIRD